METEKHMETRDGVDGEEWDGVANSGSYALSRTIDLSQSSRATERRPPQCSEGSPTWICVRQSLTLTGSSTADAVVTQSGSLKDRRRLFCAGCSVVFSPASTLSSLTLSSLQLRNGFSNQVAEPWGAQGEYGGGSLLVLASGSASLLNVEVADSESMGNGGCVAVQNSGTLHMHSSRLTSCRADVYGGGLYVSSGGVVTIEGTELANSRAGIWGGGIFLETGRVSLSQGAVVRNASAINGGCIEVNGGSRRRRRLLASDSGSALSTLLEMQSVSLHHCHSTNYGAAISVQGGHVLGDGVNMTDSMSLQFGGAMILQGGTTKLKNTVIRGNYAGENGGAVNINGGYAELTDALVAENQAGQFGGAVYLYEGVAVFTRLTFSGNSLTSDYPDGQDIFVYDNQISASLFVRDTTFTDAHRMIGKNFGIQALTDAAFEAAVKMCDFKSYPRCSAFAGACGGVSAGGGQMSIQGIDGPACAVGCRQVSLSTRGDENRSEGTENSKTSLGVACTSGFGGYLVASDEVALCEPGTFQLHLGAKSCPVCRDGQISSSGARECLDCRMGQYQDESGQGSCKNCSAGSYNDRITGPTTYCEHCDPGTFQSEEGSRGCISCPGGYFQAQEASASCTSCPKGFFANGEIGENQCTQCSFLFTSKAAATSCTSVDIPIATSLGLGFTIVFVAVLAYVRHWWKNRLVQQREQAHEELRNLEEILLNPLERDAWRIDAEDITLGDMVGRGGNGKVYLAKWGGGERSNKNSEVGGVLVAAKEITGAGIADPFADAEFEHEARMLTQINHPRVLRVYGFITKVVEGAVDQSPLGIGESKSNDHPSRVRRFIITDYAPNGSLATAIEDGGFSKAQALDWAAQTASGLHVLHRRGFMHRDVKPGNILLDKDKKAVIADLGSAKMFARNKRNQRLTPLVSRTRSLSRTLSQRSRSKHLSSDSEESAPLMDTPVTDEDDHGWSVATSPKMTQAIGTRIFMAPEQFTSDYGPAVDVWAFGILLTMLFTGRDPYPGVRALGISDKIMNQKIRPTEVLPDEVPHPDVKILIDECLSFDAERRPTFETLELQLNRIRDVQALFENVARVGL